MDHVIVWIFPRENAAPTGTAQGRCCVLDTMKKKIMANILDNKEANTNICLVFLLTKHA